MSQNRADAPETVENHDVQLLSTSTAPVLLMLRLTTPLLHAMIQHKRDVVLGKDRERIKIKNRTAYHHHLILCLPQPLFCLLALRIRISSARAL